MGLGKTIREEDRTLTFLKDTVRKIYSVVRELEHEIYVRFPHITPTLPEEITFVHAEELAREFPELTPKQREEKAARRHGAIFIMGIGGDLSDGKPHDGRAPDYDDWSTPNEDGFCGLNGDIVFGTACWNAPSNSRRWASVSALSRCTVSSDCGDAPTASASLSTAHCSRANCPRR